MAGEELAQLQLADFAGRGVGQLIDEGDLVGQPPLGDAGRQKVT